MGDLVDRYKKLGNSTRGCIKGISFVIVVILIVAAVFSLVCAPMIIDGKSMSPALSDKDIIIIDKISYRFTEPERYDMIAFSYRYDKSQKYIKRIIGLPGERLYINDNVIYIYNEETDNFERLKEYYGSYVGMEQFEDCEEVKLGNDEYFVLGDNRYDSDDSRMESVGLVKRDTIIGKAVFRVYPFNGIGSLKYQ